MKREDKPVKRVRTDHIWCGEILLAVLLVACGRDYPQKTRDTFLDNCTQQGGSYAYCKCTLERLEDTYTHGEFLRIEQEILRGRAMPDEMEEAVLTCRAEN